MKYKIGITQWSLPGENQYSVAMAKHFGFETLQLELGSCEKGFGLTDKFVQQSILADCKTYGIKLSPLALNDLCSHGFVNGFNCDDGRIAKEVIDRGLEVARDMKIEGVTLPNFFENEIETNEHYLNTIEALRYACEVAKQYGLLVYTENVLAPQSMFSLRKEVAYDNLRLLFDSQNYNGFGHSYAVEVLQTHWNILGSHVHLKDGDSTGSRLLGEGTSPFTQVMEVLKEQNYSGDIVFENSYSELPLRAQNSDVSKLISADINSIRNLME